MKCSIVVLTYNSQLEKLFQTLKSILNQQNLHEIEIVVSDDGSKNNYFKEIITFFKEHEFENYKLISSEINKGTVENFYAGVEAAKGEYIKGLGCGDLLFESNTVTKVCTYMEENAEKIVFGLLKAFKIVDRELNYWDCTIPMDIKAFKKENQNQIKRNIVAWGKLISGASIFWEKNSLMELLNEIKGRVKYCEDYIQIIALVKGIKISFYDENVVWYEMGEGISTSNSPIWQKRVKNDYDSLFMYMEQKYPDNEYVLKRVRKLRIGGYPKLIRGIIKFLIDPGILCR